MNPTGAVADARRRNRSVRAWHHRNVVQPGPVDTEMNPAAGPMAEQMHSYMAIKRDARPEEIAAMVAYLAGPDAAIVTGAMHTIDGGFGA